MVIETSGFLAGKWEYISCSKNWRPSRGPKSGEETVPEKRNKCRAWGGNGTLYLWRAEGRPGWLEIIEEEQNSVRWSWREARSLRALKDMERSLDFLPSTMKWSGLRPGHEMIWYLFLKAHFGCWVKNDPLYAIDLFYIFNSTWHNLKLICPLMCLHVYHLSLPLSHQ